jgi:hypothetical protein
VTTPRRTSTSSLPFTGPGVPVAPIAGVGGLLLAAGAFLQAYGRRRSE